MKGFSVVIIAVSLLLIILTSPPYSRPGEARSGDKHPAYWVNPDGSRDSMPGAAEARASQRPHSSWVNPDGVRGTEEVRLDHSFAKDYPWMNPDGTGGKTIPVHARADGTDSAL